VYGAVRMLPRKPFAKNLYLLVFLGIGLMLVHAGAMPLWLWLVVTVFAVGMRVLAGLDVHQEVLSVTDVAVTRQHGSRVRRVETESVRWNDLTRVEALSRETGPNQQDVLFLLHGRGGNGVAIASALADQHGLPAQLQAHLPGFDVQQLEAARAATERARFVLWER